jgi:hypothetical protein
MYARFLIEAKQGIICSCRLMKKASQVIYTNFKAVTLLQSKRFAPINFLL